MSSKIFKPTIWRLAIGAIAAASLVVAIFWLVVFARRPAPDAPDQLYFTLVGDPAWVENRDWQTNVKLRQISHPDWTLTFVLPPKPAKTTILEDRTTWPTFYLDKQLDQLVLAWSQAVQHQQWQQLWDMTTPESTASLDRAQLQTRLNAWTQTLTTKQLKIESVNFYLPLEPGTQTAQTAEITAVWAIRRPDQSSELVTTTLVMKQAPTATHGYAWDFNLASLPLFDN